MGCMAASDAAPLPRLGDVFFDVRGESRTMRLSWYAGTGVAVFSIWQGGTCTGTFRLPIAELPRMVAALQRGPAGAAGRPAREDGYAGGAAAAGDPLPGGAAVPDGDAMTGQWEFPGASPAPGSGYTTDPATGGYPATPATSGYTTDPATGGYPATPATSGYTADPATGGYPATPATSGHTTGGFPGAASREFPAGTWEFPEPPGSAGFTAQPARPDPGASGYGAGHGSGEHPAGPASYPAADETGYPQQQDLGASGAFELPSPPAGGLLRHDPYPGTAGPPAGPATPYRHADPGHATPYQSAGPYPGRHAGPGYQPAGPADSPEKPGDPESGYPPVPGYRRDNPYSAAGGYDPDYPPGAGPVSPVRPYVERPAGEDDDTAPRGLAGGGSGLPGGG
jgi:hypothetical protein